MMMAPTFRKKERIVSNLLIETLFEKGNSQSLAAYPLRAVFLKKERQQGHAPVQILISVPKKPVDRNRVKRQIREAYRLHKQLLGNCITDDQELLIAFIWLSDSHCPSNEVEKRMISLLQRIAKK